MFVLQLSLYFALHEISDFEISVNVVLSCYNFVIKKLFLEMKKKRKEADLKNIVSQIGGLENRIKYSQSDLDNTERRSMNDHREVGNLLNFSCMTLSQTIVHSTSFGLFMIVRDLFLCNMCMVNWSSHALEIL